jgi:hypothetical protein
MLGQTPGKYPYSNLEIAIDRYVNVLATQPIDKYQPIEIRNGDRSKYINA